MIFKIFTTLKKCLTSFVQIGTSGTYSSAENRITIFTNVIAIFCTVGAITIYFQLKSWGIEGSFLVVYFILPIISGLIISLNYLNKLWVSKIVTVVAMNLTAWNALIFYGKSFNGYLLFYVAIVFSIIGFRNLNSTTRWLTLIFSFVGLPLSDYFTHRGIFPITGFHSSQAPLSILVVDSFIMAGLIISMLLIEKFLSEQNELDLKTLNSNLEKIVQKRTELLNAAKEEAMAASRAKSQFVANTSHELRTPLGAIIGFVDLILASKPSELEKKEYLQIIHRNANQLLQIVNEVLDLSKIEAQKLQIEKEVFQLHDLIEDIRLLMTLKAEDKGLIFKVIKDPNVPELIYSDPLRLKQILINLTGNAIKFTEHGEVTLKIQFNNDGGFKPHLLFDITDTGPGINAESAKSLFQPFSQGDTTLMRKFGGTGLGLALSKSLTLLLDGELRLLETEEGKGSTFRLKVECIVKDKFEYSNAKSSSPISSSVLQNKKILLVDDSHDNQFLVSQYLSLSGANVDIASNGKEALLRIKHLQNYDVILMDLQMPVMDGYETTRLLREEGCTTPIVAFTAHAMKEEKDKSQSSGFTGYLTKPVQRQKLIATLTELAK